MTCVRLHYHLIWPTFERQLSISSEQEKMLYGVLYRTAVELGLKTPVPYPSSYLRVNLGNNYSENYV